MGEDTAGLPPIPADEEQRLQSLHDLGIIDQEASERFDRITRLVQRILGVPVSTMTLVDEQVQWFRSKQGLEGDDQHIPREISFCAHAINHEGVFEVRDTQEDPRFVDNPFVTEAPNVRFYAGAPIHSPDGAAIGSLCALDSQPRELSEDDIQSLRDLAAMAEEEIAALNLSITDELTGLANRRGMATLGGHVLQVARRMEFPAQCLYVDVDGMKAVNDSLGHDKGDDLLRDIARLLEQTFRDSDVIARLGGDEFCVLLTGTASEGGGRAAERLRENAARLNEEEDRPYTVRFSVGSVGYRPEDLPDLEGILVKADTAMYEDKNARRAGRDA